MWEEIDTLTRRWPCLVWGTWGKIKHAQPWRLRSSRAQRQRGGLIPVGKIIGGLSGAIILILPVLVALAFILRVSAQATPEIQLVELNPLAIFADGIDETTISVHLSAPTESVIVRFRSWAPCPLTIDGVSPDSLELFDDGTHGDSVAGDLVFTRSGFTVSCGATFRDHFVIDFGAAKGRGEYYAVDPTERDIDVSELGPTVRRSEYIVNLQDDAGPFRPFPQSVKLQSLARQFYEYFPDDFDFLAIASTVLQETTPYFHVRVKQEVQGIGLALYDDTASFGSAGRLQGVSYVGGPYGVGSLYHELMHQWGVALDDSLEISMGSHWGAVDIPGKLFGLDFEANGDGSFTITRGRGPFIIDINGRLRSTPYPPMELYLMGLIPPEEVPPMTVLRGIDPATARIGNVVRPTGTRMVEIGEVIGVHGPRIPDHTSSQKEFRLAGVLVTSGRLATNAEMVVFDRFMRDFSSDAASLPASFPLIFGDTRQTIPFRAATGGRATIEAATVASPQRLSVDFTHFANGGNIVSSLVLVNPGADPVRPAIYFYDQQGHLMDPDSVVDVTGDLEVAEDGSLSVLTEIEPLGVLTISTHGHGELVSGSMKVLSDGPLGGVVRFGLPGIGVAGVGASPPVRDAIFPARRQAGGIRTAAALHNLGAEAMEVNCRLMSGGVALEEAEIPLEANGQASWFIEDTFTATDTSAFLGSVRCTAPGRGRFTAIAVEMDAAERIFNTLSVVPVDRTGGRRGETVLDFAHFVNGTWITDLVFVNLETQPSGPAPTPFHTAIPPSRPAIYFYDTEGALVDPASVVDVTGDLEVTEDGALTVQTEMEPLGVLTISTHGQGELVSGSVRVVSEGPIGGMLRFEHPALGVAGVGASPPVSAALFPVRRQEGGITTGVALHNLESSPGLLRCDLMREGVLLDAASIPLEANGQTAWLIDQAFPAADTSDFAGSVRCDAVGEGLFTAVALEMDPGNRIFTTLPVVPVPEMPSQE